MFGSICGEDDVEEGFALLNRKSHREKEEVEEEDNRSVSEILRDELPMLRKNDEKIARSFFPVSLNMYRSGDFEIKERKYGSSPCPLESLYIPSFGIKKFIRNEKEYWRKRREKEEERVEKQKKVKYVGEEIHELFHQAENGPLSIIFAFMNVSDVLNSLYYVSKLFHRLSLRYFELWYVPKKESFERMFQWYECPCSSDIYLGVLKNKRFSSQWIREGVRYKIEDAWGGEVVQVTHLTFSIHHNFEEVIDFLMTNERFKNVSITEKDFEEAAKQYNDKILLKLYRLNDSNINENVLELSLKAFLYRSNLEGIRLIEKYNFERKSKLSYYVYSKFFVEKTFLDHSETNIEILNFVMSDTCEYRFILDEALNRNEEFFRDYVVHMDESMIKFLLTNEHLKQLGTKISIKQTEEFILSIMNSQELKSVDEKKKIIFYILNELKKEDTCFQFEICRKESFVFVIFFLENGTEKELFEAIESLEISSQKCFDFQSLVRRNDVSLSTSTTEEEEGEETEERSSRYTLLMKVLETKRIPIVPEYFYYYVPISDSSGLSLEDEEFIDILLPYFEVTSERDHRVMETLLITSLNHSQTKMMRKLLRVKGSRVSSKVVLQAILNYQSSRVVNYLLERCFKDLVVDELMDLKSVWNDMLRLFKECCLKYPRNRKKRYKRARERVAENKHFVPDYQVFRECHLKEAERKRLWKRYSPKCVKMVTDFFCICLRKFDFQILEMLLQSEVWDNAYAMFLFYDGRVKECEYFRQLIAEGSLDSMKFSNPVCFKCRTVIHAYSKDSKGRFAHYGWSQGDFRRCSQTKCCMNLNRIKDRPLFQETESIKKVFCKDCSVVERGKNYCVDCLSRE